MSFRRRKALVTGASRGIGAAIARALVSEGMQLFITARNERQLNRLAEQLASGGGKVAYAAADLTRVEDAEEMFASAVKFLGGVDLLVNNAGMGINKPVVELDLSEWEAMFAVNLRAPFLLSKLAAKIMIAQGGGHIINIGSGASQSPIAGYAAYCATKHGLLGFSESLALELRQHSVKVSIIMPGSVASSFGGSTAEEKMAAKPGILQPEDVANAVLYLLKQQPRAWTSMLNLRPLNLGRPQNLQPRSKR